MKYLFEEGDLNPMLGSFLQKDKSHEIEMLSWQGRASRKNRVFYLTQLNTDGLAYPIGEESEAVLYLNKNKYIPLQKRDVLKEN
jgi:hypothetical protein